MRRPDYVHPATQWVLPLLEEPSMWIESPNSPNWGENLGNPGGYDYYDDEEDDF